MVSTVTGDVGAEDLGIVLMHEHVVTKSPGLAEAFPETYPTDAVIRHCTEVLSRLRAEWGVQTIVDHTTIELGRDVGILKEISARSGMQIIACTGIWVEPSAYYHHRAPSETAELFTREIRSGVTATGIRPGVVKCGIGPAGLTDPVERAIRAAALAHRATGVPVTVHTSVENQSGLMAVEVLREENVDLRDVIIGHSGDTENLDYLRALLDAGVWLGMDRFGVEDRLADDRRVRVVSRLCAEGYAGRLLLSHDASCWSGRLTDAYKAAVRPNWHFRRIFEYVIPSLRSLGVPQAAIDTMLQANPRALFSRPGRA